MRLGTTSRLWMIFMAIKIIETVPVEDKVDARCIFCSHSMEVQHISYSDDLKWYYRCEECNSLNPW